MKIINFSKNLVNYLATTDYSKTLSDAKNFDSVESLVKTGIEKVAGDLALAEA